MTTLAGAGGNVSGSIDGTGSAAMFNFPSGVAVSTSGIVYVADKGNNRVRMISPTGALVISSSIFMPVRVLRGLVWSGVVYVC